MIIVTGGSKGLGYAICQRLISKNIEVICLARNVENIKFPNFKCDVSKYDELKSVYYKIKSLNKKISGLINVAGIASMNLALTTPKNLTEKIINTNLLGTIYSCQIFAPLLIRNKSGSIINFSTIAVNLALKGESIYIASKAGVEGFSRSFAREMSDFNINVNCIAPGPIETDLIKGINTNQIKKIVDTQILPRQFDKDDICDLVEIIIDQKSKSISGQIFNVGGI